MKSEVEQKIEEAIKLKENGNKLFKQKDYVKALRSYHQANLYLSGILDKSSPMAMYSKELVDDEIANKIKEVKFSIYMNMGQIYIYQEKFEKGIDILKKAEAIKQNTKLKYRKAICLMKINQFQEAEELFKTVVNDDPSLKKDVDPYQLAIRKELNKINEKSAPIFKKMFS